MSDSADVHSQAVAAAVPHQQSTNPLQSKTGELHTKKKEFPAHAGWLVLFGEPFAVDPFKHQEDGKLPELDSEAKYIQRYNVLNANKAFDGYGLIVEVVTASGEVRVQQHIFVAKDPTNPNEEVELSDRKSLYAVIQDIKNELRLFLRPRFEERLRLRCIAEGIHSSNGGESLSDVLTSIGDASVRGMEQEIDAIKRIKRSLTHRPFIRKVVGEFFADKPYVPTITNEKISSYRGLDRAVLRKKSHPNWTGHYFFQQAMIECGKPLARKVSEKCPQAMLRASKKQKLNNASAKQSKSSSDSLKIRKIQVVLSGASPVEMLIPILQKVKAIIDQPADSSNEEDANPSNPNNTSVGGTSNEHENGILQDSELLEAAATAGIHLTHQGDVNQNLIPNIDENVIAEPVVSESTLSGIEVESMMSFCAPSRPQHQEDDEEESSEGEENSDGDEEIGNRNGDGATRRKETDEERDERIERLIDEGPSMMTKNNNDAKFSLADVSEENAKGLNGHTSTNSRNMKSTTERSTTKTVEVTINESEKSCENKKNLEQDGAEKTGEKGDNAKNIAKITDSAGDGYNVTGQKQAMPKVVSGRRPRAPTMGIMASSDVGTKKAQRGKANKKQVQQDVTRCETLKITTATKKQAEKVGTRVAADHTDKKQTRRVRTRSGK